MAKNPFTTESVEFDTPANRIIAQQQPKNQFKIDTSLPDLAFLRQLSIQGRLIQESGDEVLGLAKTVITLTPASGETIFIYSMHLQSTSTSIWTVTNSGTERGKFQTLGVAGGSPGIYSEPYFDSIVGDGTKTLTIKVNISGAPKVATLLGWKENTSRIRDVI